MQTIEQKREVFVRAFFKGLWPADCFEPLELYDEAGEARTGPARNSDGLRNLELLRKEIDAIPAEDEVDLDYARKIFFRLRDQGNIIKQTLVRKPTAIVVQAPAVPNPAANLPDPSEPLLLNLRCLEDISSEQGQQLIRKVMQLGGHGVGGTQNDLLNKLNRRLAYIQTHRIERDNLPEEEEKPQPTQVVRINRPPEIAEALTAIDRMNLSNVGFTSSSQGRRALLSKKQETLRREIHRMSNEGARPAAVLAYVQSEIRKFGESSIR